MLKGDKKGMMRMQNKPIWKISAILCALLMLVSCITPCIAVNNSTNNISNADVANAAMLNRLNDKTANNTFVSNAVVNSNYYTLTEFKEGVDGNIEARDGSVVLKSPLSEDKFDNVTSEDASYIIVRALNSEGIEIASIEGSGDIIVSEYAVIDREGGVIRTSAGVTDDIAITGSLHMTYSAGCGEGEWVFYDAEEVYENPLSPIIFYMDGDWEIETIFDFEHLWDVMPSLFCYNKQVAASHAMHVKFINIETGNEVSVKDGAHFSDSYTDVFSFSNKTKLVMHTNFPTGYYRLAFFERKASFRAQIWYLVNGESCGIGQDGYPKAITTTYTRCDLSDPPIITSTVTTPQPPIANFTYTPENPVEGEEITFDASSSYDPDGGEIVSYNWTFGDGNSTEGEVVTYAYSKAGNYTVTVRVTDNEGLQNSTSKVVEVKDQLTIVVWTSGHFVSGEGDWSRTAAVPIHVVVLDYQDNPVECAAILLDDIPYGQTDVNGRLDFFLPIPDSPPIEGTFNCKVEALWYHLSAESEIVLYNAERLEHLYAKLTADEAFWYNLIRQLKPYSDRPSVPPPGPKWGPVWDLYNVIISILDYYLEYQARAGDVVATDTYKYTAPNVDTAWLIRETVVRDSQLIFELNSWTEKETKYLDFILPLYSDPYLARGGLLINIASPAIPYITAPDGSHAGYDPLTGELVFDFPIAISDPGDEPFQMFIPHPAEGEYLLSVVGTMLGNYTLSIQVLDSNGIGGKVSNFTMPISKDEIHTYSIIVPISGCYEWLQYTSGTQITALVDDGNYLWVGSYGGLTRLDKTTEDMTHYNTANSGLPDNMISSIAKDVNGDWWIGTDNGLAKFDGTSWAVYKSDNSPLPRNGITCLAIDADGNKWIGVFMGGLVKFDGINWTVYNTSNSDLPTDDFREIIIDAGGNKWLGTNGGGLAKFDGTNWTVYNVSNSGIPGVSVSSIAFDVTGDMWIGCCGWGSEGLAKFDGTNWTVYNTSNSPLPDDSVRYIAIDTDGNKWVGADGLVKFDGTNWTVYNPDIHAPFVYGIDPWCIVIDASGNKWVGDYGGLAKFDGTNWTAYNTGNSELPDNHVQSLAFDDEGNKWIGTWFGGLSRFDGTNWDVYLEDIPDRHVMDIAIAGDGNKWILTWDGLSKFNGTTWTVYNKDNSGLPEGWVTNLAIDTANNLWMVVYSPWARSWDPSWSPDGTMMVFTSDKSGNSDIWIMDADGRNLIQITTHPNTDWDPAWSPDGNKIAFGHDRDGNGEVFNIWVVDVDGTNLTQLTFGDVGSGTCPAWSPDGTKIAYDGIWVMNADGTNLIKSIDGIQTSWAPDGSEIAFSANGDIWIVNVNGSNPKQITTDPAEEWHPSFSPDGTKIAFTLRGSNKPTILNSVEWYPEWPEEGENRDCNCNSSVYTELFSPLPSDSSPIELQLVTTRGDVSIVQQPYQNNNYTAIIEFDDNPMGGADWYEVIASYSDDFSCELNIRAYIDGRSHLLIQGSNVWWHHYDNAAPGRHYEGSAVWTINVDGTNATKIVESSDCGEPQWSPDGTKIAFEGMDGNIWVVDADGGNLSIVTSSIIVGGNLVKYDGTNWTVYDMADSGLQSGYVSYLAIDIDGNVWIGASPDWDGSQMVGGGLIKFDGTSWTFYNTSNSELPSNYISGLAADTNGNVWVGTYPEWDGNQSVGGGLVKFDGTNWTVYNTTNSALPGNYTFDLTTGKDGNIWMRSAEALVKFDGTDWTIYNIMDNSGLPNRRIESFVIDVDGGVWIGTWGGLGYFSPTPTPTPTPVFDTGTPSNPYPSISGTHTGTITPNQTITVSKLYTYPCAGTGGHTKYARIWNNSGLDRIATWSGYKDDWHNITFDEHFTLFAEKTYYYEIRTGSYPQIIHTDEWEAEGGMGIINCTSFVDANGKVHNDWIPAIRLE